MTRKTDRRTLFENGLLQLLSLIIGVSLWYFVVGEDQVDMILTMPIELHNLPQDLVIANQYKRDIEVTIRGPRRMIQEMRQQNISRPVDLSKAEPGAMVIHNDSESILLPRGLSVQRVQPANITLLVDKLLRKELTITPVTEGKTPKGFLFDSLTLNPDKITVTGPESLLGKVDDLKTHVIDIGKLDRSSVLQVRLDLDDALLKLIGETVIEADVQLKEVMVKKKVRRIPINAEGKKGAVRISPTTATVLAEIPEQIVAVTPELTVLFRAVVELPPQPTTGDYPLSISGVTIPGHDPIVIQSIVPEQVHVTLPKDASHPIPPSDK